MFDVIVTQDAGGYKIGDRLSGDAAANFVADFPNSFVRVAADAVAEQPATPKQKSK